MNPKKRKIRKWIKANCVQVAKHCRTRTEYMTRYKGAYVRAYKEGWIDEIFPPLESAKKPHGFWTFERVAECAALYDNRQAFRSENSSAYDRAKKKGWLAEITAHMPRGRNPNGTWTIERCADLASGLQLRSHFKTVYPVAYQAAHTNGWLDQICAHMDRGGSSKERAIYTISNEEALTIYIGLSWDPEERYAAHKRDPNSSAYALTRGPHLFQIVSDFMPKAEAALAEPALIEEYRAKGWTVLNEAKAGSLGGTPKWTKAKIAKLAKPFDNRAAFRAEYSGAYRAALRDRYADEVFAHMKLLHKEHGWTDENVAKLVAKYDSPSSLEWAYPSAYAYLNRHNMIDMFYPDRQQAYTYESAAKVAAQYPDATALNKANRSAYISIKRNGWLNDFYPDWLPNGKVKVGTGINMKRCSKCQNEMPATTDYFHKQESGLFGVKSNCKNCHKIEMRRRYHRKKIVK